VFLKEKFGDRVRGRGQQQQTRKKRWGILDLLARGT